MTHEEQHHAQTAATVSAHRDDVAEEALDDVASDPALNDIVGSDWTDEGGATADGPATTARAARDDRER